MPRFGVGRRPDQERGERQDAGELSNTFAWDRVENVYADSDDWDAAHCRTYASEHGLELPAVPTVWGCVDPRHGTPCIHSDEGPCEACKIECDPQYWQEIEDPDFDPSDDTTSPPSWLTEAREACREHAQDNPAEVYAWYRIDPWLCGKLRDIGEVVIDNGYGCWWGRQATGQKLIMDGTLQQIAASFEAKE